MRLLNNDEAKLFALLIMAGAPTDAIVGKLIGPDVNSDDDLFRAACQDWPRQPAVLDELERLAGGQWQSMPPEQRLKLALDKHYAEMAYLMWVSNYGEADGALKQKLDTCRQALESKLAGTAGKGNALEQFYQEIIAVDKARRLSAIKVVS